jgi:hypothetical protein
MKRALLLCGLLILTNLIFAQWTTSGSNVYLTTSTNSVGIGNASPGYKLDVSGTIHSTGTIYSDASAAGQIGMYCRGVANGADGNFIIQGNNEQAWWLTGTNGFLRIGGNGGTEPTMGAVNIDYNGHVGINTLNTNGFNFNVNGTAVFDQVTVQVFSGANPKATPWADYVFDRDYQLPSIYSVADYIKANNHLPGIPTTAEVKKNGLDLGATQAKLLEKIEQLTLYTIQLQHQVDSLNTLNDKYADLQRQIDMLKKGSR